MKVIFFSIIVVYGIPRNCSGSRLQGEFHYSTAAKGYDCAFCDKSTKIGTLVVLYI